MIAIVTDITCICELEIKPFTNKGPMDYGVQLLRDQNLTCN